MAAGINGSTVLLQVRTATGPDVYTTVGGQRGLSVSRERTAIETSAKDDTDATFLGGRRNSTVSMEGLVLANGAGRSALITAFEGDGTARVRRGAIGAEAAKQCDVIVVGIDEDFPDDEESTWTVELQVTGAWGAIS